MGSDPRHRLTAGAGSEGKLRREATGQHSPGSARGAAGAAGTPVLASALAFLRFGILARWGAREGDLGQPGPAAPLRGPGTPASRPFPS